jgi:2-desacetyl-2-hydroxyethyl bacteriochlorophyllide A dehydrogenase
MEDFHMRAMAVVSYSAPLKLIDLPEPGRITSSVLIRILTCGVCYTDVKISSGHMPFSGNLKLPHVPGHEICGEVIQADPENRFKSGDRVVVYNYWSCGHCYYCQMGLEQLCESLEGWVGFTSNGGFEDFLNVPSSRLTIVPENVTSEQAAIAPCSIGTGYRALITKGQVKPGQNVVILGVGGVGIHALQIAKASGARSFAVDINQKKLKFAKDMGAMDIASAGPEAETMVLDHTRGLGADIVIDTVGKETTLSQASKLTRKAGRVIGVGYDVSKSAHIQTDEFVLREIEFLGSRYMVRNELDRALSLIASGQVIPVIDRILPLEQADMAMELLKQGDVIGRIVLNINNSSDKKLPFKKI